MPTDRDHMGHALALGRRGQGQTAPNPAVGCVLVRDGRIVGRGWTQPGGRPHAEVMALAGAGDAARGATAYVTLEPCSHHGHTGPCADALIAAGVARVVVAIGDPDTRVAGRGIEKLRAAGIEVTLGLCAEEATRDLRGFLLNRTKGRPEVTLKLAMTLDGRIATASGESQWITGPAARRAVHGMRLRHDAVMVGAGTARADDPGLTVRDFGDVHQPMRVIISRKLDLPRDSQLASTARDVPVCLIHGEDADAQARDFWRTRGAVLREVPLQGRQVDMGAALAALGEMGQTRVFCEGGGQLASSLLTHNLVDRLVVFTAGLALGAEGQPGVGALGLETLAQAHRFQQVSLEIVGGDILSTWERSQSVFS
ncbi:bifunctional diaminohydroxyphosphoribosylaminopyrimidine deaminase/5-amino-6-(5-phosphoribosylamino)uracil reductase RibD [Roseobacteraceae bacterium S113]